MKDISGESEQTMVERVREFIASEKGKKEIIEAFRKSEESIRRLEIARRVDLLSLFQPMTI